MSSKVVNQGTLLCTMYEYNDWMQCLLKQTGLVILASNPENKDMRTEFSCELKAFLKNAGSRLTKEQGGIEGAPFTRSGMPKGYVGEVPFEVNQNSVGDLQILRSRVMHLLDRLNTIYPGEGFAVDMKGGAKKRSSKK